MTSNDVKQMNQHLGKILILIEEGSASNNAQIREEIKSFFAKAEYIEKEICKKEVESLNYIKQCELQAIKVEIEKVTRFIENFDDQIKNVEDKIRAVNREESSYFNF